VVLRSDVPDFLKPAVDPLASADPAHLARARLSPGAELWHKPVFILFLLVWAVNWVVLLLRVELSAEGWWLEALLPVLAAGTSVLALGRRLPLQNVLVAAAVILGLSTAIVAVGALSGVPFGPLVYSDDFAERLFTSVPWPLPLLWVALIINGRGVARLIMRPWRKTNFYGYWVIGLACLLAVLFDLGLEPFAVQVKGWWIWLSGPSVLSWHTAPWVNGLGWFVTALSILALSIPWLINKQPVKQPMDYHPLVVWLLLNLWVATGNAMEQLWLPVGVSLLGNAVAAVYAVRGARW
jgi:uncharacterized membrane protein